MTPKGHAIPSKTQLLSYGTPALLALFFYPYRYWESACFSQEPSYSKDPTGDLLHGFAYDV